ncbi:MULTISPECIES: ABC transporter ATP-binding protein [Faecalicoccus]|uniref:ABC transporter ATP-binding protein n=1 Tax=Faecalicoccus pleomorphus TaxID=1323 RepID=A0AAW6CMJ7_9FIRM|nr:MULTISPECIES: ABC transporter ATP-binding protein [Faecalicoccus]MDB7979280.1 ABC transporter ATP-binding protein [Faecalicoccus pleomorphus]MDB7981588.1 ABC transporter ATP-binding protein [Faecalicoccus pleomorphus]
MKRLYHYLRAYPLITILAPLFKMLEATFELFVPLVVAQMIDVGIAQRDAIFLWKMTALLILLGIIGFAFSLTAQYFAAKSAVSLGQSMRKDLFAHINTFSFQEIDRIGTSTLINRMTNDINLVQNGLNMFLRLFLRSPFVVLGAMVMAFSVNVKAALIFAVVIPALMIVVFAILLITMPLYKKVQQTLDRVLLKTRENLTGIRVVRAFAREDKEKQQFHQETDTLYQKQIFVGKISALLNPLTYMIVNLGVIAILYFGGLQVNAGELTQGEVIALINYMFQILTELVKLANLIILLSRAFASLGRVNAIFEVPSFLEEGDDRQWDLNPSKDVPAISFDHVSFQYAKSGKEVLQDISFQVQQGETIGIIGATGSGKSTLAQLLCRFYDHTKGKIYLFGKEIETLSPFSLREHIGFVEQKATLFSGTLRKNMQLKKKDATDEEIWKALDIAQAREFVEEKKEGLNLEILQKGSNLSGGQRQRLSIARALVGNPDILILDDSASALDFATDAKLRHAIRTHTKNQTVLIISQRVSAIYDADHILVMEDGRLAGYGRHEDLMRDNLIYQEICASQSFGKEVASNA